MRPADPPPTVLAQAHDALPAPQREALAFGFLTGLTAEEVGELMGLPGDAVAELQVLGLLALGDAVRGTHVLDDARRDPAALRRLQALARAAGMYTGWRGTDPPPALRRCVLEAAAAELDNAAPAPQALVRR